MKTVPRRAPRGRRARALPSSACCAKASAEFGPGLAEDRLVLVPSLCERNGKPIRFEVFHAALNAAGGRPINSRTQRRPSSSTDVRDHTYATTRTTTVPIELFGPLQVGQMIAMDGCCCIEIPPLAAESVPPRLPAPAPEARERTLRAASSISTKRSRAERLPAGRALEGPRTFEVHHELRRPHALARSSRPPRDLAPAPSPTKPSSPSSTLHANVRRGVTDPR